MYIRFDEQNTVVEIIPDIDPTFPDIPIASRYPAAFVASLLRVADDLAVQQNHVYDPATQTFSAPPIPEPVDELTGEPAPPSEPSTVEVVLEMLADHEYRLCLQELGVTI